MIIRQNALEWRGTLKPRTSSEYIIYHHAEASHATLEEIHIWHLGRGWSGIGYNFYIRKDGTVYEGRPIWAADADAYGYNENSLSVCFEGNLDIENMTEEQIKSGIDITRYLKAQYPTITKLFRHMDVNQTSCPGKNFDNKIIIESMKEAVTMSINEAVELLHRMGIINSPEYWLKACDIVKNLEQLIIKFACYAKLGK